MVLVTQKGATQQAGADGADFDMHQTVKSQGGVPRGQRWLRFFNGGCGVDSKLVVAMKAGGRSSVRCCGLSHTQAMQSCLEWQKGYTYQKPSTRPMHSHPRPLQLAAPLRSAPRRKSSTAACVRATRVGGGLLEGRGAKAKDPSPPERGACSDRPPLAESGNHRTALQARGTQEEARKRVVAWQARDGRWLQRPKCMSVLMSLHLKEALEIMCCQGYPWTPVSHDAPAGP